MIEALGWGGLAAVRPDTARARCTPAWTSSLYCSAAPTAPPPGATLDRALPASWEVTTGNQSRTWIEIRWSAQRQAIDAA